MAKAKQFVSDNPKMLAKWDYEKNEELGCHPENVLINSKNKVYWKCEHGHSYESSIISQNRHDCPVCSNKKVVSGYNDFATKHPELLSEFCGDNTLSVYEVSYGSGKKASWICPNCGNRYIQSFYYRHIGRGCPICANKKKGDSRKKAKYEDSLSYKYPDIAAQFDKSNGISPEAIYCNSNMKYLWNCDVCGEKYEQSVYHRISGRIGCQICKRSKGTSLPEQIIYYYLSQIVDAENRVKVSGKEIDIYIPSQKIAIEYNGKYYHRNRSVNDAEKAKVLHKNGVKLLTVKECEKSSTIKDDENTICYIYDQNRNYAGMERVIRKLCEYLNVESPEINIQEDLMKIKMRRLSHRIDNSFAVKRPDIVGEFDYEKNGNLTPWMFSEFSATRVWWKCQYGHSWFTSFGTRKNCGCPICSKKKCGHRIYTKDILQEIALRHIKNKGAIPKTREFGKYGLPSIKTFKSYFQNWQQPFITAYEQLHTN